MKPARWTSMALNAVAVGFTAFLFASVLGGWNCGFDAWRVWMFSGWKCAAWLLSAFGLGLFAKEKVFGSGPDGRALAFAFGIGIQLLMDQWLGTIGLLSGLFATVVLIPGWLLALRLMWIQNKIETYKNSGANWWWPALPAMATLLVAASVSPGILWSTEFGGYDALEYHLQAPKEWMAVGTIRPLEFLAYAGMPNIVEGGFLHLMSLATDARDGAVACQLLHGSLLFVAAFVLADTACILGRALGMNEQIARTSTLCALLATPWMIVVGSLAYSESGILLAFAAILNVFARKTISLPATGLMFGSLMAVLVGSKASSIVLVVPAVLAWIALWGDRRFLHWKSLAWSALAMTIGLAPWLARNWYYAGAPFFPLATNLMGAGWWSGEQVMRWNAAHASAANLMQRALALWNQLFVFGAGENPNAGEPWKWFWGPLPWIGVVCITALSLRSATKHVAMVLALTCALIVLGWMFATHLQSRFLIPMAIPLSLAFGLATANMLASTDRKNVTTTSVNARKTFTLLLLLAAWACLPAWNLTTDTPGSLYFIGQNDYFQGDDDWRDLRSNDVDLRTAAAQNGTVELVINHWRPEWRVLSVGWSTPFWIQPAASLTWSSVWDTNAIECCDEMTVMETIAFLSKNYDALIIDVPMLERWKRSGWLSPKINLDLLKELSKTLPHLAELRGGKILLGLRGNAVLNLPAVE